eukprot:CAMPEP_0172634048 /NCGR_PEP_ID=MMETSP1068-20121228/192595_1 /TAXON_ID=35684 /ORGANISM="Pseudopedinella elastica, Strain CCMP716" /LENGTH=78 /DNA_ID=CAMNT_0013445905 /DNA_START=50 /DNA_END=286 /DNA_ORIENTATION=-
MEALGLRKRNQTRFFKHSKRWHCGRGGGLRRPGPLRAQRDGGDSISRVETQPSKDFWNCPKPESDPYCYEIPLDLQAA